MKRQLNREMRKLGFTPEKGKEWRSVKSLARVYTNGEIRIGVWSGDDGMWPSRARIDKLPAVNRMCFLVEGTRPGEVGDLARELVRCSLNTAE